MATANINRLGTRLRALLERLDGDVQKAYSSAGLAFRPRYTPIVRAIFAQDGASLKDIARHSGLTHSAVSQTVALMTRDGLLTTLRGRDGRERCVAASPKLQEMLPRLEVQWAATNAAAAELDRELSGSLSQAVDDALDALERSSFGNRIAVASQHELDGAK